MPRRAISPAERCRLRTHSYVKNHVLSAFGRYRIVDLRPSVIEAWMSDLLDALAEEPVERGGRQAIDAQHQQAVGHWDQSSSSDGPLRRSAAEYVVVSQPSVDRKSRSDVSWANT